MLYLSFLSSTLQLKDETIEGNGYTDRGSQGQSVTGGSLFIGGATDTWIKP
jgi:hypothetical protein